MATVFMWSPQSPQSTRCTAAVAVCDFLGLKPINDRRSFPKGPPAFKVRFALPLFTGTPLTLLIETIYVESVYVYASHHGNNGLDE